MTFTWPLMLFSLLLIPLLLVVYLSVQRRRRRLAEEAGSLGLVRDPAGKAIGKRRHIPHVFFLAGLASMLFALARPQAVVGLPKRESTVILAFDVSGSMSADDIQPTRLEAAKAAARLFVQRQPSSVQIGVVAFSESGIAIQAPTNDQQALLAAINRLAPQRGTSIANGILASLRAIAYSRGELTTTATPAGGSLPTPTPTPVPYGTHIPAVIVLLTDGENTTSPDPLAAARTAAQRGVRVYTIGVGSAAGTTITVNEFTVHTQLDEGTLKQIAQLTDGAYFNAESEEDLQTIYKNLDSQVIIAPEKTEITSLFAGLSLLLLLIGGGFSLFWFNRLP